MEILKLHMKVYCHIFTGFCYYFGFILFLYHKKKVCRKTDILVIFSQDIVR